MLQGVPTRCKIAPRGEGATTPSPNRRSPLRLPAARPCAVGAASRGGSSAGSGLPVSSIRTGERFRCGERTPVGEAVDDFPGRTGGEPGVRQGILFLSGAPPWTGQAVGRPPEATDSDRSSCGIVDGMERSGMRRCPVHSSGDDELTRRSPGSPESWARHGHP